MHVYGGVDCVVLRSLRAILTLIEKYVNSEGDINMHTSDAELNMNRIKSSSLPANQCHIARVVVLNSCMTSLTKLKSNCFKVE